MTRPRETKVEIAGEIFVLLEYYNKKSNEHSVTYRIFYARYKSLRKRNILSFESLNDGLNMSNGDWITFYGGGKYKDFIYDGTLYPEYYGKKFRSLSAFLKLIGKYEKSEYSPGYALVKSRLQRNWDIDDATDTIATDESIGRIYVIKSNDTKLAYVGQTIDPIRTRFKFHLYEYLNNKEKKKFTRPLYEAFEKYNHEKFNIYLLEDNIPKGNLAERENHWIKKLGTMFPDGLNKILGQHSASGQGKKTTYQDNSYNSVTSAVKTIKEQRPELNEHFIEKHIRRNKPLPETQRKHSKHPEAGSNLWRRWKGLLKNENMCHEWSCDHTGYECFKGDIGYPPSKDHKLYKIDANLPHSKENSEWLTRQEAIERTSGKEICIHGVCFPTHSAAALEYGLARSTLMYRLKKGQTPEQAVCAQEKTTKRQGVYYQERFFSSHGELYKYAAQKYQITISQAKDRWVRGLPFTHSPKKGKACCVKGMEFESEKAAAEFFCVPLGTFAKRRGKGLSIEKSLGLDEN